LGRRCPLHYRYPVADLAAASAPAASALYVVGGLYGNAFALDRVEALVQGEPGAVTVCFNGDFNWFNRDPALFEQINRRVLATAAIRGNVETEISSSVDESDCGCAYPHWVDQGVVDRSNQIIGVLRATAQDQPDLCQKLAQLPMYRCYEVAGQRVAVVHGDPESLAGWGLSQERVDDGDHRDKIAHWHQQAAVDVFACTHTCLPFLYRRAGAVVINNGAAGMPNFSGSLFGVITRIADTPSTVTPLYGIEQNGLYVDALSVHYSQEQWLSEFTRQWPVQSPAYQSYFARLEGQVDYPLERALRDTDDRSMDTRELVGINS